MQVQEGTPFLKLFLYMDINDVKLTKMQLFKAFMKMIYHEMPWRYVVVQAIATIFLLFNRGEDSITRAFFASLFLGTFVNMFLFWLLIPFCKELIPVFISKFEVYKAGAKKEALEKVDDQLLK